VQKPYKAGDVIHRTNLYKHLVKDYQKHVNPDNADIKFGVSLIDFDFVSSNVLQMPSASFFKYEPVLTNLILYTIDLQNEKRSTLETNLWLRYVSKYSDYIRNDVLVQ